MMIRYHAVMIDETGCEFGASVEAATRDEAYEILGELYEESRVAQLESPEDSARREHDLYTSILRELDNSKTQWPYEGIRPCRSMRPARVSEKIIAWRELPSPDTAGSSDPAVASPNGEHLRPLADREKSAATPVPEPQAVAWHWMAKNKMSTCPAWSLGPERPAFAPVDAIPLFAAAPLSGGDVKVTEEMVEIAARASILRELDGDDYDDEDYDE